MFFAGVYAEFVGQVFIERNHMGDFKGDRVFFLIEL